MPVFIPGGEHTGTTIGFVIAASVTLAAAVVAARLRPAPAVAG
jgi:hypothetical protein